LILHHPASGAELEEVKGLAQVHQPGAELLRRLLETVAETPQITTAGLLERFRDDQEGQHLGRLTGEIPLDDGDAAPRVLRDNLKRIVENHRRERLSALLAKGRDLDPGERRELEGLLKVTAPRQGSPEKQA
jgi:DNA primase